MFITRRIGLMNMQKCSQTWSVRSAAPSPPSHIPNFNADAGFAVMRPIQDEAI
jgi:hypothetical protein